jgi:hypothetical protein
MLLPETVALRSLLDHLSRRLERRRRDLDRDLRVRIEVVDPSGRLRRRESR